MKQNTNNIDLDKILQEIIKVAESNNSLFSAISIGGSHAAGTTDSSSDIDIFIYVEDKNLASAIKLVEKFTKQISIDKFHVTSLFFAEGFGFGRRITDGIYIIAEFFVMSPIIWKRPQMAAKTKVVWKSDDYWINEIKKCQDSPSKKELVTYVKDHIFPLLGKMKKYKLRGRNEAFIHNGNHCYRYLLALEEHIYQSKPLEPENVYKSHIEDASNCLDFRAWSTISVLALRLKKALNAISAPPELEEHIKEFTEQQENFQNPVSNKFDL